VDQTTREAPKRLKLAGLQTQSCCFHRSNDAVVCLLRLSGRIGGGDLAALLAGGGIVPGRQTAAVELWDADGRELPVEPVVDVALDGQRLALTIVVAAADADDELLRHVGTFVHVTFGHGPLTVRLRAASAEEAGRLRRESVERALTALIAELHQDEDETLGCLN